MLEGLFQEPAQREVDVVLDIEMKNLARRKVEKQEQHQEQQQQQGGGKAREGEEEEEEEQEEEEQEMGESAPEYEDLEI